MYNEDFVKVFFKYLSENVQETCTLSNTLSRFIEYGWNNSKTTDDDKVAFINWMAENGADMNAIKAAMYLLAD